ncbi:hypothetical protein [Nocardioides sp. WS12]|uniref:hypothetical protein n=1 Tax=Nocardioides sp. WS12 TaxID=2486272 RepID=UPI0015FE1215|nr:hypothetical protein [Nocardioides sp. WS12]
MIRIALMAGLMSAGLTTTATAVAPAPAPAAARISVVNDKGTATADNRYRTKLTINGAGFQSVQGGFGGVYVMFGWVDDARGGSWKPSKGGVTGSDYRYIPDSEDASNQGYLRFVAFPGGSTTAEAHAVLSKSGGFQVKLTVPGPTFQSVDRNGKVGTVDCTKVTCGVITIGAHGVKNPANETFTPVRFTSVYDAAPAASSNEDAPAATADQAPVTQGSVATPTDAKPVKTGAPRVITDRLTAKVGNTLAFTGTGFTPGEQVLGILDDGVAGIGPMVAGPSGEVAGILPLPGDLAPGTHELRLTGAASGSAANERFAVRAADNAADMKAVADDTDEALSGARIFLVAAAAVLALAVLGLFLRRRRGVRA